MKKVILLVLLVCLMGITPPTLAQNTPSDEMKCDLPTLQKLIDTYIETLKTVKAKETDPKQISNDLQLIANIANSQRAACDGLSFSGSDSKLIGPVTIPAGTYRAKATTTGYIIVDVTAVDGQCGAGSRGTSEGLFSLSSGEADKGAEALFTSKGCTALIELSLIDTDWQLAFERITTS